MNNDDFVKEYNAIVERALMTVEKATRDGILSIEELIDEEKYMRRDIFEFGLRLIVDHCGDDEYINKVLGNIVELETDKEKKVLKEIQKEAVIGILDGWNQRRLLMLLNSHVNLDIENTMKKCEEYRLSEFKLNMGIEKLKEEKRATLFFTK